MEINIKILEKSPLMIDKARALYEEAFEDDYQFTEYYFSSIVTDERTVILGGFMENVLVTMLFLRERQLIYGKEEFDGCYIYGVATKKEYRGRGCMGRLMRSALKYCEDKGCKIVYLIPADENIYKSFGFETVKQGQRIMVLCDKKAVEDENNMTSKIKPENIAEIKEMSLFSIKTERLKGTLAIKRDENYYKERILQAEAENAGVYIIRKTAPDKEIQMVLITGTDENNEICIKDIICGENEKKEWLIKAFLEQNKFVRPYIRKYPVMIYKSEERLPATDINDEV